MKTSQSLSRRDFLKSAGAIVVGFSWSVPGVLAQQASPPRLPGSLQTNRMLDGWLRINANGTVDHLHREMRARPGHHDRTRADRLRRARRRLRAHRDGLGRHRAHAQRGHDRRQPVGGEQRHGPALRVRGGAADPARACRGEARNDGRPADGIRRHDLGRRREGDVRGARARSELQARGDRPGQAQAVVAVPDDRKERSAPRHPVQGHRAAGAMSRTCGSPAWCSGAWCARPHRARSSFRSTRRRSEPCLASSPSRATAASSASRPSARNRRSRRHGCCGLRRNGTKPLACRHPRRNSSRTCRKCPRRTPWSIRRSPRCPREERSPPTRRPTRAPTRRTPRWGLPARWRR